MEPTTVAALGALLISTLGMVFQTYKFIRELRDRAKTSKDEATKSVAERDSIAVKTSEGVLLMMKGLLDVAKASEAELRLRVRELEVSDREKEKRIRELEAQVQAERETVHREREEYAAAQRLFEERVKEVAAQYERKIQELQQRMVVLEDKTNGEEANPGD